ncbi:MAG: HAD family hydrolase [Nanobdellota archaeon]
MRLFLFDVDGTLIKGSSTHYHSFAHAISRVFGKRVSRGEAPGKVDWQIIQELLDKARIEYTESQIKQVIDEMVEYVRQRIGDEEIVLLPGVQNILGQLEDPVGLLTGNIQQIAHMKLARVNLSFDCGAFGDDADRREDLVPIAKKRAEEHYGRAFDEVYVIGDTPADIQTAKANNAYSIAVATGGFDYQTLLKKNPDYIFRTFNEYRGIS